MTITIERQVPERGTSGIAAAPAGQCCCCCCCCLHSVGSAVGALTAKVTPFDPAQLPVSSIGGQNLTPQTSAAGLYWVVVAVLCFLVGAYFTVLENEHITTPEFILLIALTLPGIQLFASGVTAFLIIPSNRVGKEARMAHLGRITLRSFVGALIGIAIMIPLLFALK